MGISIAAFTKTQGFGKIHPGEDPDLSQRIKKAGFTSQFIEDAFVYHKRRISWKSFYKQVNKFGMVRPILNTWHPESAKITFWFPTLFIGSFIALLLIGIMFFNQDPRLAAFILIPYAIYFGLVLIHASVINKSLIIGILALRATLVQFIGYGWGFLKSTVLIGWLRKDPKKTFPHLFFD